MSRFLLAVSALFLLLLIGCGGGGGGGSSTDGTTNGTASTVYSGLVYDVVTGIPVTPAVTVNIGGRTTTSDPDFGNFSLTAPRTSNAVSFTGTPYGNWNFNFPATTQSDLDLGVFYIGPDQVTVTGRVLDATTNEPISGAVVAFAGRTATTNANGRFSLSGVAYSNADQSGFFGIVGQVGATGYVTGSFDANGTAATDGEVAVPDVLLFSSGDTTPPDGPYNLTGQVIDQPEGTTLLVELLQGDTVIRSYSPGTDDRYYFWVEPGTYVVRATAGTLSRPVTVTVTATNIVKTQNIDLVP